MKNYHVTKNPNGTWNVRREKSERASKVVKTQKEAEKISKQLANKNGGGEVVIHGENGKIRDKDTVAPAKDPMPPKDRVH